MLKEVRCPACRRLAAWAGNPYRPFCSERCRLRDLGNWAMERYRIPAAAADAPASEAADDGDDAE